MSEVPTSRELFEDIQRGLEPYYWGCDPYGTYAWEYKFDEDELILGNSILRGHGIEPAEKIDLGRQVEPSQEVNGVTIPAQETASISFYDGKIIQFYTFVQNGSSNDIVARKDLQVDGDNGDLIKILRAALEGHNPLSELRDFIDEMHQISEPEMLAISGLTQILLDRIR